MTVSAAKSFDIARLMGRFRQGDRAAAGELVEIFYPELRRLAGAHMMRERAGHTWQPTALVSELYLELIQIKALRDGDLDGAAERDNFFRLAAHLMRRLLIHHARPIARKAERVELFEMADDQTPAADVLAEVDNALNKLSSIHPLLRSVVEAKVFEGLTNEQTAERLGCACSTVDRHWAVARRWLAHEFGNPPVSN